MTPALLFRLAGAHGVGLPTATDAAFASLDALAARYAAGFAGLDDFLVFYYAGLPVLRAAADFDALATTYFERAAADGVRHADLSFDVQVHLARGVGAATILAGLNAARARAAAERGITSTLVCCFQRHLPAAEALAAYAQVAPYVRDGTLAGIGLDSSEAAFPDVGAFAPVYDAARADGARLTAHAGEELGPEAVRDTLAALGVERVDHARTAAADPALVRELAARGTLVTLCPLSNVVLRAVKSVGELPVREFLAAGVKFSVNGDDPAFFGGWTLANWCAVQEAFELAREDWRTIATNSVEGSWCSNDRKAAIREMIDETVMDETTKV